jgi:hypothetical protein
MGLPTEQQHCHNPTSTVSIHILMLSTVNATLYNSLHHSLTHSLGLCTALHFTSPHHSCLLYLNLNLNLA